MAGLFFDNGERQSRLKDLYSSFNDIRQEMSDTVAAVVSEGVELKKSLESLQGKGKVASMQELQAKAKARMTDAEYQEYKDLVDKLEKTDHDLSVAWSVIGLLDGTYLLGRGAIWISSRIGAYMVARALNQAINAAQLGIQIPAAARNLAANGAHAMRPRAGAFHIPAGAPGLARLQRLQNFMKIMGKLSRIWQIIGKVLLAATAVLAVVDVIFQDSQRTDLMKAITDLFGARHVIKQFAMAIKSEARHVTDARISLNERATKDDTLNSLVADGTITAERKAQVMAEYDAKKKAEADAISPTEIPLPPDQDVYKELKARDDLHHSWQNNDPDFQKLLQWLKTEAERPHHDEPSK